MKQNLLALMAGILFGLGLSLSQMVDRSRVLGFLDVTGNWDATLLFVLGGAVGVTVVAFRFVLRLPKPVYEEKFYLPKQQNIDAPLVLGAAILEGDSVAVTSCPGPAITGLIFGSWNPVLFVLATIVGSLSYGYLSKRST
mgnify:CR=1 FL=1